MILHQRNKYDHNVWLQSYGLRWTDGRSGGKMRRTDRKSDK